MQTITRNTFKLAVALLMVVGLLGAGFQASPAAAASCVANVTMDLYAKSGTATLFGTTAVPILGYAISAGDPASLPGPQLDVNVGDCVQVTLYNVDIPSATSLLFQGQALIPDTTGVVSGGSAVYTFSADNPGTFLYEAGLVPGAQYQVAMGMYGALIVHPVDGTNTPILTQAYDDASTAFDGKTVMVLSELDTNLNFSGSPTTFDMRNYNPQYFLINGKAYPDTAPFDTNPAPDSTMLMRYVNAGLQAHAMSSLGLSQTIIAQDGQPYAYSHNVVAETIATGQTLDTLITVPASAAEGVQFPIFDANMLLHNSNTTGFGGMMTFLTVGAGTPPEVDSGPTVSGLSLSPNPTDGSVNVTVSATVTDSGTNATNIQAAEFYIDSTADPLTAMPMTGSFNSATSIPVTGTIDAATLAGLSSGNHTIYVRGQDSATTPNWGPFLSITLNLDKTGPATSGLSLTPNPIDGSVVLTATGDDTASGGSNVDAAEYWLDGADPGEGLATAMTVDGSVSSVTNFTTIIPAGVISGLSQGAHTVSVRSRDAFGNWGTAATITLQVGDTMAPTTSNVMAAPNPNNGSMTYNTSILAVRVTADFSDVASGGSNIATAEGFLDTVGATGTGFVFIASDGSFNSPAESGYGDIPIASISNLPEGDHTIYVHAQDAAGNWSVIDTSVGAPDTTILTIDKTAPTFTGITLSPNPTVGASSVTLTIDGADASATGGEYWIDGTVPAVGGGTSFTGTAANIDVTGLTPGTHTVSARIHDALNNWTAYKSTTLTVSQDLIFSDGFETGDTSAWTSRSTNSGGRLSVTTGAVLDGGVYGLQARGNSTNYVQYNFTGPSAPIYDAGFYFDPNGNGGTNQTIFAASSVIGSNNAFNNNILFQVRYRQNGGLTYVQIQAGTTTNNAWVTISDAPHWLEVVWQSGNTVDLYVDGVLSQTLTAGNGSVASIRLGSVVGGGNSTVEYFDGFASKSSITPLLGP